MAKKQRLSSDEGGLASMTVVEHLEELRKRLFVVVLAVVIGTIIGFTFRSYIIAFLQAPLPDTANMLMRQTGGRLVVMGLTEGFTVYLLLSLAAGIVLALPVLLYQIWAFVSPALYERERKNVLPFILVGLVLFLLGLALAYLVLRFPVQWLIGISSENFTALVTADSYFKFVAVFLLIFGLIFELPLILTFVARVGLISRHTLEKKRAYIHFIMWVIAAFGTPGADIYSPVILGVAMSGLFELSILFIRLFVKDTAEEEEEEEKELQTV